MMMPDIQDQEQEIIWMVKTQSYYLHWNSYLITTSIANKNIQWINLSKVKSMPVHTYRHNNAMINQKIVNQGA